MSQRSKLIHVQALPLAGMITAMTLAQILFKFAGKYSLHQKSLLDYYSNPWLWSGLLASALGMICWIITLRKMPLAEAYPWTALIYVLTPLASAFVFGDVFHLNYLLGMGCIVSGIFIISRGTGS